MLFFQNGRNRAISEGIQNSLLGAINGGKQTADVSKMHLGSSTQCISKKLKLVHKRWSFGAETVFFMILRIASKRAMFTPLGATNFQLFGPGTFK